MYKNFKDFNEKIHHLYGKGNFTKNIKILQFIEKRKHKM